MDKLYRTEIELLLSLNREADYRDSKEQIILLLKEFARRLLLWSKAINDYGVQLNTSTNLIFDVVQVVRKEEPNAEKIFIKKANTEPNRYFSFFDEYTLAAYFKWERHKDDLIQRGFCLPNPYRPYLEVFKLGGYGLRFESPTLEVYPFLRVLVHPRSEYVGDIPFWEENSFFSKEE